MIADVWSLMVFLNKLDVIAERSIPRPIDVWSLARRYGVFYRMV